MRRSTSSPTLASTTAVCQRWFTINSTGSAFLNACSTSWLSWSVGVWRTKHQVIDLVNCCTPVADVASRHRRSATCTAWSFRGIDVAHSVGGPSLSGSDCLEFTACRTAWTGCKRLCLTAHIEDDLVREILVTERNWDVCVKLRYRNSFWHLTEVLSPCTLVVCVCTDTVDVLSSACHRVLWRGHVSRCQLFIRSLSSNAGCH